MHPIHNKVTRAEVKITTVLAHHNVPIALADHLSPLFRDVFSDSEIAKAYSCARTKATCILNGAVGQYFQMSLVDKMKTEPFSLATDGSNDSGLQKMNSLTVRISDVSRGEVITQLLDMCLTSASTAESIYGKINDTLMQFGVDWDHCVAFSVDNTSVNLGCRNSIRTRVHQQNPSVYFIGCPCHMVHNTATKSANAFEAETRFDAEDLLVDLYYWFDKSTKRKNTLAEFCTFCDMQYKTIVKHVSTRWLSLELAIQCTLQQYQALKSYFLSEDESQARFQRLRQHFDNPITEVYLMFYQAVLPCFTSFNTFLQRETPCIHLLQDKMESFVIKILGKFVKVTVIKNAKDSGKLLDLDFLSLENQMDDSGVFVGFLTKQTLQKLLNDGDIADSAVTQFYKGVRMFYTKAVMYIKSTFPLKDDLLRHARSLNFEKRGEVSFDTVESFVHRFPYLHALRESYEMALLQDEFISYQLLNNAEIPPEVWAEAKIGEDEEAYYQIDTIWGHLCKILNVGSSEPRFKRLAQVAVSVLVIPHSNASEERVFSMVRKNKTPFRPSLGLDGTLQSILQVKLGIEDPCEKFEPTKDVFVKAKKATWEYNKAHSSRH